MAVRSNACHRVEEVRSGETRLTSGRAIACVFMHNTLIMLIRIFKELQPRLIPIVFLISALCLFLGSASDAQECKRKILNTRKVSALKDLFLENHSVRIFPISDHDQVVLADWRNAVNAHLLILEKVEQEWRARFITDELLWGKSWNAIKDVPNRNEKFAIVDHSVESPGWELMVLFSKDFGANWELRGCIKTLLRFATKFRSSLS